MTSEHDLLSKIIAHIPSSIKENQDQIEELISGHTDILQSIHDTKVEVEPWEIYFETLIIKIIYASKSSLELSRGSKLESLISKNHVEIIDFSSLYILTRSIIENFLTLEYLYFNNLTPEEKKFRFQLWQISGLMTRQLYNIVVLKKLEEIQKKERDIIETLKEEIFSNPLYKLLDKRQRNNLDGYGLPRSKTWHQLLNESILKSSFLKGAYSLFSDYAHSEYLSAIQINESSQNIKDKDNLSRIDLALNLIRMVNAVTISCLKNNYSCCFNVYNTLPKHIIDSINLWNKVANEL